MTGNRHVTLLFMPPDPQSKVVSINMRPSTLAMVLFALTAVLFLASTGTWSMYRYRQVTERSYRLEAENRAAISELRDAKEKVEHLNREILKVRQKAGYIQNFLGMNPAASGKGRIGQGGIEIDPRSSQLHSTSASPEHPQTARLSSLAREEAPSLKDIGQLDRELQQIIGILEKRQERLDHMPSIAPVDPQQSWISSSFGMRTSPFTNKKQFHVGIDIAGGEGTPIMATARGQVVFVGTNGSLGLAVRIRHDSAYETVYGHLDKATVKKGQRVQRGEVIGHMGDSGKTTGYHVHYEVKKNDKSVDPFEHMMDWEDSNLLLVAE